MSRTKSKLTYREAYTERVLWVRFNGAISDSDRPTLATCFTKVKGAKQTSVVFDFGKVPHITSQCVGEIVMLQRKLTEKGRQLTIQKVQPELFNLLKALKLDKLVTLERA